MVGGYLASESALVMGGRTHGRTCDPDFANPTTGSTAKADTGRLGVADRILTLSQLAVYLEVPRRRIYRLIARHPGFPVFKSGRHWCADIGAVLEWLLQEFEKEESKLTDKDRRRRARQPHGGI